MKPKTALILCFFVIALVIAAFLLSSPGGLNYPREQVCRTDLAILSNHLEQYKEQVGHYPTREEGLNVFTNPPSDPEDRTKWRVIFYDVVPLDPWKRPYIYRFPGRKNPGGFDLFSLGPDGIESPDDIFSPPTSESVAR